MIWHNSIIFCQYFVSPLLIKPAPFRHLSHRNDTQSVVISSWAMLVLADPVDRCWTLAVTQRTHTLTHTLWESRYTESEEWQSSPLPHICLFHFPFAPTQSPASPLPFFSSPLVAFSRRFVSTLKPTVTGEVHSRFMVGSLRFVDVQFRCFHQTVTPDKNRYLDVCLKNVGQTGHEVCTYF